VRRREFITLVGSAAMARPLAARAQQGEGVRRIGVLMARKADDAQGQKQFAALRQGLTERGWSEGKTLHIETRWSVADAPEALIFAQELVASKPEVLVANGTPSLVAMRQATSTIPVVFVSVADPLGQGFVPSLARPGGNITGFSAEEASMGGKWLELLKELAPRLARIAIIYNPETAPYAPMFFPAMQAAAPRMAVALSISPVHSPADIERVVVGIGREPGGGLIVVPDSFIFGQRRQLTALARQHGLPAIYPLEIFIPEGGLIAYGIERVDIFHRAADYVDRILRGTSPTELPVQQPTKFELAINLKTAKSLGLSVPPSMLLSADEVIE
jgi:putative tryptophan/tyrosine transport system substrate-binding protein